MVQQMKTPKEFEHDLRKMFSSVWDCEIDNIFWDDTVGDLMDAVIQSYKNDYEKSDGNI